MLGQTEGALVVIGNFDGVHRGHEAVLRGAVDESSAAGLDVVLLTFFPLPAVVLGRTPPLLLTRQERKRELVGRISPAIKVVEEHFDLAYAGQSPEAFCERLRTQLSAERVVVGSNFRFGKNRAGDLAKLSEIGARIGFSARSESLRGDETGPWSSTRARAALVRGDLEDVQSVLGRPHMLSGVVVHGKHLGRTIGFPTCNLADVEEGLPPLGIYAVLVDLVDANGKPRALAHGAMSVGRNPTTDGDNASIKAEVYLLDFDGDLYGARLRVHVVERLRSEEKFADLESLVRQMHVDIARSRELLSGFPIVANAPFG